MSFALPRPPVVLSVVLAAAALAACSSLGIGGESETDVACPDVRVDRDTAKLVQFRGEGQDITDVMLEAEIAGFNGDCGYDADTDTVDVKMKVLFAVSEGPASTADSGSFRYFVAIPAYYPAPDAKQILPVEFAFPEGNVQTMMVRDEEVTISIPLNGRSTEETPIYVGFQLTSKQLEYNRKMRR